MGGGSWDSVTFNTYTTSTRGMDAVNYASYNFANAQEVFRMNRMHKDLDPKDVVRECLDTEEHPKTVPVILALDVTGSMGKAAMEVSQKLGVIMEAIYASKKVPDVEFCIMALGDLACDYAPVQISQFESDVRIAEHLDKVYFEGRGGGNSYESYTAAWYMGLHHCHLDCWKRGQRGIIITLGDEQLNPYLPKSKVQEFIGDNAQDDIETDDLYKQVCDKYIVHHISVNDPHSSYNYNNWGGSVDATWRMLGENYHVSTIAGLQDMITEIIVGNAGTADASDSAFETNEISW